MNTYTNNYKKFKEILPPNISSDINFDEYISNIRKNDYEEIANNFLQLFDNKTINKKDLISFIIILNFPGVVADNNVVKNKLIIEKLDLFFTNISNFNENIIYEKFMNQLNLQLNELVDIYSDWKKTDLDAKLNEFIHGYYEFEQMYLNLSIHKNEGEYVIECIKNITLQQEQLKQYIFKTGGQYGLDLLNSKSPVYINMERFNIIATNAFWDTFQEKLETNPPDYARLIILLKELKQLFYSVVPHRTDIHAQINESIDTDLLLQMLENNAISFDEIFKIMEYIITLLQQFQSPEQDEITIKWWNEIKNLIKEENTYGKIMKEFFIGVFKRVENIKKEITIFNEKIKK
jgi:hypothetical protein